MARPRPQPTPFESAQLLLKLYMFRAANSEIFATFAKVEPFLDELRRASGIPEFLANLEAVVKAIPGAAERTALLRDQFRAARAAGEAVSVPPED